MAYVAYSATYTGEDLGPAITDVLGSFFATFAGFAGSIMTLIVILIALGLITEFVFRRFSGGQGFFFSWGGKRK